MLSIPSQAERKEVSTKFRYKMKKANLISINVIVVLAAILVSIAYASDPTQLQDFCVAVPDAASAGKSFQNNV